VTRSTNFAVSAASDWAEIVPEVDPRLAEVALALGRTARILTAAQTRLLLSFAGHGVTGMEDYRALSLLRRARPPGLQISEMAHLLKVTPGATSNRMDRLEQNGHIHRTANPTDRRSHFVSLTPAAQDMADAMYRTVAESHREFLQPLADAPLDQLLLALRHLLDSHDDPDHQVAS
jgi:DNA-binding MarR family transcriptional regulator